MKKSNEQDASRRTVQRIAPRLERPAGTGAKDVPARNTHGPSTRVPAGDPARQWPYAGGRDDGAALRPQLPVPSVDKINDSSDSRSAAEPPPTLLAPRD